MTAYVFVGPTLAPEEVQRAGNFVCLPPVAQGDVYRVVQAGAQAIGIIDGYFEGVPAVWHKEILWAITQDIPIFGSASMGALRAAELCAFGMCGVGRIFEDYRDGVLEDDDEVAVLHGPAEVGFVALSEPLVNIRATLQRAAVENVISESTCRALEARAKGFFYKERTWEALVAEDEHGDKSVSELAALRDWLAQGRVDRKAEDARAMLAAMIEWLNDEQPSPEVCFDFEWTDAWDTAIAVSKTVGLDPAKRSEAVPPSRLLDELRLDGDAFRAAKTAALARLLALRGADRLGLKVDRQAKRHAVDQFRTMRDLYRHTDLNRWMAEHDLAAEQLERLLEEEALLTAYASVIDPALDRPLLDHLRLSDGYTHLADRARQKHATLTALGLPDPEPEDLDLLPPQLARWYFEMRLGRAVPDDLEDFARRIGLEDRTAFYRLLAREYLFLKEAGHEDDRD